MPVTTRILWATTFWDQNMTDIDIVANSDDLWHQIGSSLGVELKYKREGFGLFARTFESKLREGKSVMIYCLLIWSLLTTVQ